MFEKNSIVYDEQMIVSIEDVKDIHLIEEVLYESLCKKRKVFNFWIYKVYLDL